MKYSKTSALKRRFNNFLDEIYICGLKEFVETKFVFTKFFWVLFVIFGSLATAYYLYFTIVQYREKPIETTTSFQTERFYDYPNMILCPNKWIDYENLHNLNVSLQAVGHSLAYIFDLKRRVYALKSSEVGKSEFFDYMERRNFEDFREFYKLIAKPSDAFFHPIFVTGVESGGDQWNVTKIFYMTQICYRFNVDKIDCSKKTRNKPLKIEVFFDSGQETNDYFNLSKNNDNYRLIIDPDLKALLDQTSRTIFIEPAKIYEISIRPKLYVAVHKARQKCVENTDWQYSQSFCHTLCLASNFTVKRFNCIFFNALNERETLNTRGVPACESVFTDGKLNLYVGELKETTIRCAGECYPPCQHRLYEIGVSDAEFQVDKTISVGGFNKSSLVQIFYDVCEFGVMEIREFERYSFEEFVADVGGLLGLWIGASAVTFVQIAMFALEMCFIKLS